jgi:hypothetical protein
MPISLATVWRAQYSWAAAEGVPVQQIEGQVMHGLSDHLYAAVLAL